MSSASLQWFSVFFSVHHVPQPPDVTNNAKCGRQADRIGRYTSSSVPGLPVGISLCVAAEDGTAYGLLLNGCLLEFYT